MKKGLLVIVGAHLLACAHKPMSERQPANTNAQLDPVAIHNVGASQVLQNAAAAEVILFGEKDDAGRRVPKCWANVAEHPNLAPPMVKPASKGLSVKFGLPECSPAELNHVSQVAAAGNRSESASPLVVVAAVSCAVDFTLGAVLSASANAFVNKMRRNGADKTAGAAIRDNQWGYIVGAGSARGQMKALGTGKAAFTAASFIGSLGGAALGFACTYAGGALGYWLVPQEN